MILILGQFSLLRHKINITPYGEICYYWTIRDKMSHITRKPVFGVFDQVSL